MTQDENPGVAEMARQAFPAHVYGLKFRTDSHGLKLMLFRDFIYPRSAMSVFGTALPGRIADFLREAEVAAVTYEQERRIYAVFLELHSRELRPEYENIRLGVSDRCAEIMFEWGQHPHPKELIAQGLEAFEAAMRWSPDATEHEKTLVTLNVKTAGRFIEEAFCPNEEAGSDETP